MTLAQFERLEKQKIMGLKLKLIRQLLEVPEKVLAQDAEISPEELIELEEGNIRDYHLIQLLFALGTKYGVRIDRLISGEGKVFTSKKPIITDKFYTENSELFEKNYPVEEENNVIKMNSKYAMMGSYILKETNR